MIAALWDSLSEEQQQEAIRYAVHGGVSLYNDLMDRVYQPDHVAPTSGNTQPMTPSLRRHSLDYPDPTQTNSPPVAHMSNLRGSSNSRVREPDAHTALGSFAPGQDAGIIGGEQQVTVPAHIWSRFPNTETARLKWVNTTYIDGTGTNAQGAFMPWDQQNEKAATNLNNTAGGTWSNVNGDNLQGIQAGGVGSPSGYDFTNPVLYQLRMTTPYNIVKQLAGTSFNPTFTSQPDWIGLFDSKYQYYHAIDCEWHITVNFGDPWVSSSASNPKNFGFYIFYRYTNEDDPPLSYAVGNTNLANQTGATIGTSAITGVTAINNGNATLNCTPDDYFRMGGWHHKHVKLNTTHPTSTTISGKYKYGQCKMDIKTLSPSDAHSIDSSAEGWTQSGSTPAFPEILSVIIVQDNALTGNPGWKTPCSMRTHTEHTVQFRDLRSPYKFATPANEYLPTSTGISTDAVMFQKGAGYS